jgi:hypothetical protein
LLPTTVGTSAVNLSVLVEAFLFFLEGQVDAKDYEYNVHA